MATEGAGGLSTANIARCIGAWETETQDGGEVVAAWAELEALTDRAGRATALAAALAVYADRDNWAEGEGDFSRFILEDEYHAGGLRPWDTADAALADAGPGAAGARDETRRWEDGYAEGHAEGWRCGLKASQRLETALRAILDDCIVYGVGPIDEPPAEVREAREALAALDALRAGGAGS